MELHTTGNNPHFADCITLNTGQGSGSVAADQSCETGLPGIWNPDTANARNSTLPESKPKPRFPKYGEIPLPEKPGSPRESNSGIRECTETGQEILKIFFTGEVVLPCVQRAERG